MFFMQGISADDKRRLARRLRALMTRESLNQSQIAEKTQVDQPFVSRVLNCDYKRVSSRVRAISEYVNMLEKESAIPPEAATAVAGYVASGGRIDLLCEAIELLTNVQISRRT